MLLQFYMDSGLTIIEFSPQVRTISYQLSIIIYKKKYICQ